MIDRFLRLPLALALFSLVLSGCAYENAANKAEVGKKNTLLSASAHVDELLGKPTIDSARYAFRLSDAYKTLGDVAAKRRDQIAGGIIVGAGVSALGAATSVGTDELALATVLGIGLNEAAKFTNQNGAAEAFYKSSDEMSCVASKSIGFFGTDTHSDIKDTAVVLEYIRRVELRLRSRLRRTVPDYLSVFGLFNDALEPQVSDRGTALPSLRSILETCVPDEMEEQQTPEPAPGGDGGNANQGSVVVTPTL